MSFFAKSFVFAGVLSAFVLSAAYTQQPISNKTINQQLCSKHVGPANERICIDAAFFGSQEEKGRALTSGIGFIFFENDFMWEDPYRVRQIANQYLLDKKQVSKGQMALLTEVIGELRNHLPEDMKKMDKQLLIKCLSVYEIVTEDLAK